MEAIRDQWECGELQSSDPYATAAANAEALGRIRGYKDILEIDYEKYLEVMTNDSDAKEDRTLPNGPSGSV